MQYFCLQYSKAFEHISEKKYIKTVAEKKVTGLK